MRETDRVREKILFCYFLDLIFFDFLSLFQVIITRHVDNTAFVTFMPMKH